MSKVEFESASFVIDSMVAFHARYEGERYTCLASADAVRYASDGADEPLRELFEGNRRKFEEAAAAKIVTGDVRNDYWVFLTTNDFR